MELITFYICLMIPFGVFYKQWKKFNEEQLYLMEMIIKEIGESNAKFTTKG